MDWFAPVDAYCERMDATFWSEPLNAVSNAAFLIAAAACAGLLARTGERDVAGAALVVVIAAVGLGSFLFHTLANRWSGLADVIPIAIFIHGYLCLALTRFLRLRWATALSATAAFALLSPLAVSRLATSLAGAEPALIGSLSYGPAALAIFAVGSLALARGDRTSGRSLLLTGGLFLVSLAARSADGAACPRLPFGLHWAWHLLNAVVLYRLTRLAIEAGPVDATLRPSVAGATDAPAPRSRPNRGPAA